MMPRAPEGEINFSPQSMARHVPMRILNILLVDASGYTEGRLQMAGSEA
ncbi:MAG: hypothetical protein HGA62_04795 [Chlorobiaceae bacterium]|nr:hypothetical protein [Chlorobiaceae bacterium]NTV60756.1 hypothetical protein [Chlorobiaceae bacterium]